MNARNRRDFLADVGRGMLIASLGPALAGELGNSLALADEPRGRLTFGALEPLASLMQETPPAQLLPALVEKMKTGVDLRTLISAAALANARVFGGNDYTGFHTFMALAPAFAMSQELPEERQALPVFKVLYRNANRIQEKGGNASEVLHAVEASDLPSGSRGEILREATRTGDFGQAEAAFAAIAKGPPGEAFNHVQFAVQDEVDVHRVVLCWRAWETLGFTGQEHAHTLLRQSVRYCTEVESRLKNRGSNTSAVRTVLPKLLDQYKLLGRAPGKKPADDAWVEQLAHTVYAATREQAAEAVAAALAEGFSPRDVSEAITLAANTLVLRDPGRRPEHASAQKPAGSVHGDSVGVHASDAANAWRNIALASDRRNAIASLVVAAFHTAGQKSWAESEAHPLPSVLAEITAADPAMLLKQAEAAIRDKDQARAAAIVHRYGQQGQPAKDVFDLLLRYAVSEDGALHAEKYYRTVTEEFAAMRPTFRWRQLVALARVTASEFGQPAPGYAQACELLGVA
jgi:hypothetical protein